MVSNDLDACQFNYITGQVVVSPAPGAVEGVAKLVVSDRVFVLQADDKGLLQGNLPSDIDLSAEWWLLVSGDRGPAALRPLDLEFVPVKPEENSECVLSICIPTFNRAQRCIEAVKSALACPSRDIEVVVRDNGSEDDTLSRLAAIEDDRLSVYKNGQNFGPIPNFNYALASGKGRYVLLHSDEDTFCADALEGLVGFLKEHPTLSCGLTSVKGGETFAKTEIFSRGHDALSVAARTFTYIGGFFFRRADIDFASLFKFYDDPAYLYPFENLCWSLCTRGDFTQYAPEVVKRGANDQSFFPRLNGRHFNHPSRLVDQYMFRRRIFEDTAKGILTDAEIEKAFLVFSKAMMRQNFTLSYELPLDEKLEVLQKIRTHVPGQAKHMIHSSLFYQTMAEHLLSEEDVENALMLLRAAVEADSKNVSAHFLLADMLLDSGKNDEAEAAYQSILQNTRPHWAFLLKTYNAFRVRGRSKEAKLAFDHLNAKEIGAPKHIISDTEKSLALMDENGSVS